MFFSQHEQTLYQCTCYIMQTVDEPTHAFYRCHEIARFVFDALEPVIPTFAPTAKVVDGNYAGGDHSWIRLNPSTILDPYAIARFPMVQLIDVGALTLARTLYVGEGEPLRAYTKCDPPRYEKSRTDIRCSVVQELLEVWNKKAISISDLIERGHTRCQP